MVVKFNLIAAACENMGIGKNKDLPWRLKSEMAFFTRMTSETEDKDKKNIVLMGRKTWDCIPPKFKPLNNRINFVLSRSKLDLRNYEDCYSFTSLEEVIDKLEDEKFMTQYEKVWVIGGSHIYEETMKSKYFHRLYLTKILQHFDCDTFFPEINENLIKMSDPAVPGAIQEEKGIKFIFQVYENPQFNQEHQDTKN